MRLRELLIIYIIGNCRMDCRLRIDCADYAWIVHMDCALGFPGSTIKSIQIENGFTYHHKIEKKLKVHFSISLFTLTSKIDKNIELR